MPFRAAPPAACHTCRHPANVHREAGNCLSCDCVLHVAAGSPRAVLREAAADLGWRLVEREQVDDFRRGHDWVTVIYSGFDRPLATTTPEHYAAGRDGTRLALDRLLTEAAPVGCDA